MAVFVNVFVLVTVGKLLFYYSIRLCGLCFFRLLELVILILLNRKLFIESGYLLEHFANNTFIHSFNILL